MEVRSTQDGMLRAFHLLLTQQSKPRQAKPKYVYRPMGNTVHASRCLTKAEAEAVNAIVDRLNKLNPRDDANTEAINGLFKELSRHPVHFVASWHSASIGRRPTRTGPPSGAAEWVDGKTETRDASASRS